VLCYFIENVIVVVVFLCMRVEDGPGVNLGFRGGEPKNAVVILVSRYKNSFEGLFTSFVYI